MKCDGTRAETRFRLSGKLTSPFKSAGASVQSTTGCQGVRISSIKAGYIKFRGGVKRTGYTLHSPVSPSLPLPCGTVCHHVSNAVYHFLLIYLCSDYVFLFTPWSRVPLEKLTGSAASQEIPRIFGTRRFLTVITSAATCPYPEPTPSSPHHPLPFPEDPS